MLYLGRNHRGVFLVDGKNWEDAKDKMYQAGAHEVGDRTIMLTGFAPYSPEVYQAMTTDCFTPDKLMKFVTLEGESIFIDPKTIRVVCQLPAVPANSAFEGSKAWPRRTRIEYGREGVEIVSEEANSISERIKRGQTNPDESLAQSQSS